MRLKNISVIVSILFCIIVLKLWHLQIIKGEYYQDLSENNRIRLVPIPAVRGRILDTNGHVLADSQASFQLGIVETELKKKQREQVLHTLSQVLNIPYSELEKNLLEDKSPPFVPKIIVKNITRKQAITVEIQKWKLPGVIIQVVPLRKYPWHQIGCHVLGHLGLINRDELTRLKPYGFQPKDFVGRSGIEKVFDQHLRGQPGGRQLEVDRQGHVTRVLSQREPLKGADLHLSLDIRVQKKAEELLGHKSGVIIVMNVHNGQILTLASRPGYDPAVFIDPRLRAERQTLINDIKNRPLINRALSGLYPPGSIFKIVVAAGVLERKKIGQYTTILCPGYKEIGRRKFRCWREYGHGDINISQALASSCNVFFYSAGLMLGPDAMAKFARIFGLGRLSKLELGSEKRGLIPSRRWKKTTLNQPWYKGETANYAIGQGYITITPISALIMISAVANGGYLVRPSLIKGGRIAKEKIDISSTTLKIIRQGLFDTVQKEYGTAFSARIKGLKFSGKTGTAQAPDGKKHGWFVGYAPSETSEISFVVLLEETKTGGPEAAKIAGELVRFWNEIKKRP